jgi:beta-lactamase regulating signal transducer with metallopeptidase domain
MTLLTYLLKVIVVSAIMYGYYRLFLRNKLFHHYNRYFLLSALVLSIVLPFIRITLLYQPENAVNDAVYRTVSVINPVYEANLPAVPLNESVFTLMNGIYLLYTIGALFLLTLVFKSLLYIRTLRRRYTAEKITSLRFYNTHEPGTPFSFFRSIFWNDQLPFNSSEGQQIFRHELFHVKHQHSVDRLLSEVLTALFWFNPFFHLIKKELKAIHEFLADQFAISHSDRYAYATLLVQQALEPGRHAVTNHFFQNHIKRRIAMITQFKQSKYGYWSRVMILPVSLLLFCFISVYAKKPAPRVAIEMSPDVKEQPLMVQEESGDEGTGATSFGTGNHINIQDTIPKTEKEKELLKQRAKQLEELKRKAEAQEEVMKKMQRNDLESLKKQMMEQEMMAKELEQNRRQHQEEALKLKMEMQERQQNMKEAVREQQGIMQKMIMELAQKAKEDPAYREESEKKMEDMKRKLKEIQEHLQMKQQAEAEMMKTKMLEVEMKSKEHMEMSKARQAALQNMKQQLKGRENLLKKQQQEELRRFKEELQRQKEEMNEKERELKRKHEDEIQDKERELRRQKENKKEESSFKPGPAKMQKEDALSTKTFALNYNLKDDKKFQVLQTSDWETKMDSKFTSINEFSFQDTIPAKRAERAERARPAKPREPRDRDLDKPRLSGKPERRESLERVEHKMRKNDKTRDRDEIRKREDLRYKTEARKTLTRKPVKAKEARKPVEKLKKIKTKPAKEGESGQESDNDNEENASDLSVNGDK